MSVCQSICLFPGSFETAASIDLKFSGKITPGMKMGLGKEFRIIRKRKVRYDVTNTSLECRNKLEFRLF